MHVCCETHVQIYSACATQHALGDSAHSVRHVPSASACLDWPFNWPIIPHSTAIESLT